jgi:TolB protein
MAVKDGLIAFDSGSNQTFVVKPNGRGRHLFIPYGVMPTWSPNGRRVAYVGSYLDPKTDNYEPRLYVMNANRTHRHRLSIRLGVAEPAWSPDGSRVAFVGGGGSAGPPAGGSIYVAPVSGRGLQRLTTSESDSAPIWSPDGKTIAFERATAKLTSSDVFVMNADGSALRKIATGVEALSHLAWSPDGTTIAYLRASARGIFAMNANGSGQHELTSSAADSLAWSPSGKSIAFEAGAQFSGKQGIYLMSADGHFVRKLIPLRGGWDYGITIAWQPLR